MVKSLALYGVALALGAFALTWAEMHHAVRLIGTEFYILLIAVSFTLLGIWVGHRLTSKPQAGFTRNEAALRELGLTPRELQMLEHIARGDTNKHIARALGTSPNTVKAQISSLYSKLGCARRTEALRQARQLNLIQ